MDNSHYTVVVDDDGLERIVIDDEALELVEENGVQTLVLPDRVLGTVVIADDEPADTDVPDDEPARDADDAGSDGSDGEELCTICLLPMDTYGVALRLDGCRHMFHPNCVALWALTNPVCPLCRCSITRHGCTFVRCGRARTT